jgi:Ni,Fe-hydrogenase III small subunit
VTGPVTHNMREALERTYRATPDPKWVVAVGDCAVDGGIFGSTYACVGADECVVPEFALCQRWTGHLGSATGCGMHVDCFTRP